MRSQRAVLLLLAAVASPRGPRAIMAQDENATNTTDASFNSTASTTSPLTYQSCLASWAGADTSQDGFLSRAEYINWVRAANPYPNCPNISSINLFLGDLPFSTTFTDLACLCTTYTGNQTCCDVPHIEMPGTFPTNYSVEVCQTLRNVLASECTTPSASTDGASQPTSAPTESATAVVQAPPPFNVSSSGFLPTSAPMISSTDRQPAGPIEWPSAPADGPSAGEESNSGDASSNKILQVALPLLLVALAALLLGTTLILYQKRRHRLLFVLTPMPKDLPNASTGAASHSEESTESDEEHAVVLEEEDDDPDPDDSSEHYCRRRTKATTSRTVGGTGRGSICGSAVSRAKPTVRLTSLLNSLNLEPLREETCSEDEDGTATQASEAERQPSLPPLVDVGGEVPLVADSFVPEVKGEDGGGANGGWVLDAAAERLGYRCPLPTPGSASACEAPRHEVDVVFVGDDAAGPVTDIPGGRDDDTSQVETLADSPGNPEEESFEEVSV